MKKQKCFELLQIKIIKNNINWFINKKKITQILQNFIMKNKKI
jgi:hypothetical protein